MQCCLMLCTLRVFDGGEHFCKMQSWILEAGGWVVGYKRSVGQKIGSVGLGGARSAGSQRILRREKSPLNLKESFETRSKK